MKNGLIGILAVVTLSCLPGTLLSGCGGEDKEYCRPGSCSGHGACQDAGGQVVCSCDDGYGGDDCSSCATGYQDNDGDGLCKSACSSAGLDCGTNGHCDDSVGTAACACDTGYAGDGCDRCAQGFQDYDSNGSCLPKCANAGIDCGHGECYDVSGTAVCVCPEEYTGADCSSCAQGFQDNDGDGSCLPDCASAAPDCGSHGACDDAGGAAVCACDLGYGGALCGECAQGFQDNDGDGLCLPDCAAAGLDCHAHGACDDSGGVALCECEIAYSGNECTLCNLGYQDNNADGSCEKDCANARPDCTTNGHCDDSGGTAICVCDTGYSGDFCDSCASGYQDNDGNGTCLLDCANAAFSCGAHGACSDASGTAVCVCDQGYAGELCVDCANGYQDNDGDGACAPACSIAGLSCGTYGVCDDSSGTAECVCLEGYTGDGCTQCDVGYQDNDGNGTCHPDCATAAPACVHGSCDDTGGQVVCVCTDQTWGGELCDICAPGYQDNDGNDSCLPNCAAAGLSCGSHAHCDDSSGTAECACDDGYVNPPACDTCATGYQDNDGNGSCLPDCAALGYDVSCAEGGHGSCDDSGGTAVCICEAGYSYDGAGHCSNATGFDCATALPLPVANGVYSDTTLGSGDDYTPGCSSSNAEEMVYVVNVAVPVHIKFTSEGFDTIMYLRATCDDPGSEIDCDDDGGPGNGSMIDEDLQTGSYYLFIDGYSQYAGSYTLTVEISCPPGQIYDPGSGACVDDPCLDPNPCAQAHMTVCEPVPPTSYICHCDPGYIDDPANPGTCIPDPNPHGESCADMIPLEPVDGSVNDSTLDAADDGGSTSCGGNGPDRVYGVVLAEQTRVELLMTGYDTVLHIRSVCDQQASEVICNDQYQGNSAGLVTLLDPGSYYIWADSYYSGGGDYELIYSFRTDPCADEEAVCPGTPECVASGDWSSYECVCPAGTLPWQGDCIDDPCDPNECTAAHQNICRPDLPGAYHCDCNLGYIDDPGNPGTCIEDPNANEWAFIVYLNGDSNLDPAAWDDLSEMGVAGSTPYVHIVALFDSAGYSDDGHARKLYVTQGGYDVIEDMGEIDMGDWQTLRDFGIWAVTNYPARHYALIMWDHGSGWDKSKPRPAPYKGFSYDYGSGNNISVAGGGYAQALAGITAAMGGKLDIVGHDECLMGMWEVAQASAPYAHYFVASEETEPFDGWAYDGFLPGLIADPTNTTPADLAISIVNAYYAAATGNSTLSAIDLDSMGDLNTAISTFADALMANSGFYSQVASARSATQGFYESGFKDLKDFATRVAGISGVPGDLAAAANALAAQLDVSIAHNQAQSGYSGAYGLSIYLPSQGSSIDSDYTGAVWSQQTSWDEFLQDF